MKDRTALILYVGGCLALLAAVITYMTLPEARSCKMSFDNGDILIGNCTALKQFHESRIANSLIQPMEYKTLLEETKPCPIITCPPQNPCVCPKERKCLPIECPLRNCPISRCEGAERVEENT